MSQVFVVDTNKQPLNPVHPGRARLLLKQGKAAVYRRYPFTIILKRVVEEPHLAPLRVKIDPGSKTKGIVTDIAYRFCTLLARSNGYRYHYRKDAALPP
jgi:hypothetical protein